MNWFWFALIALICWSGSDLFSKIGCCGEKDKTAHLKMVVAVGLVMGLHAAYMIVFHHVSVTWDVVWTYLPVSLLYILSMTLGYVGLRYIELSISSPICNSSGALVAVLCLCTGALSDYNGPQKTVILCAVGLVCLGVVGLGVVHGPPGRGLAAAPGHGPAGDGAQGGRRGGGHGDAAADAAQAHGQGGAYVLEALGDTASRRGGLRRAGGGGTAADAHHAGQHQEGEEGGDVGSKGPLGPASGVLADADEEQGGENREGGKEQDNEFQHGDYLLRITRLCGQHSRFFSGQRGCRRRRRSGRRARRTRDGAPGCPPEGPRSP